MTERLPYEEQLADQLNDLVLPDITMAWADMKRRLDEDEDKPLLPFWLRGCAGWLLLGLLVAGLGWWILRPEKWFYKKQQTEEIRTTDGPAIVQNGTDTAYEHGDSTNILHPLPPVIKNDSITIQVNNDETDSLQKKEQDQQKIKPDQYVTKTKKSIVQTGKAQTDISSGTGGKGIKKKNSSNQLSGKKKGNKSTNNRQQQDSTGNGIAPKNPPADTIKTKSPPVISSGDSAVAVVKVLPKPDTSHTTTDKDSVSTARQDTSIVKKSTDSSKKKTVFFSAGVALHQQLPVAGQSFVPYSSLGREGSLRDYIPSAYIRLNREDKWFIQAGFRYGAPQLVKKLLYSSKADTISQQKYNTTNSYLKKTFYHQVPFSFNYFVLPNWSVGAGVVWNKFVSAVSSVDLIQTDRFTGTDTIQSTGLISNTRKADSNFVKSYFQASFETQYKWRRFSLGANYSFGLQPYIRFVLPRGQSQEEKNSSLQFFIRYELWKSKRGSRD